MDRGCTEVVAVDSATYIEALALLAQAWDRGFFPHYRRVASYVAGVESPRAALRAELSGISVWYGYTTPTSATRER
jgi:hypothetical protein